MAVFDLVVVQESWPRSMEQMGTKRKFWYKKHDGDEEDNEERWLFKYARAGTGEDWAEKLAEYLCECLGIPHAKYEMALTWQDEPGVVSPSFLRYEARHREQLILGNQLIGAVDPSYLKKRTSYKNSIHTVRSVLAVLEQVAPPRDWSLPAGIHTAQDVFVGYLMLDALVGNGDRHDENWGVVAEVSGIQRSLAPTFDHASCLGRDLSDEKRLTRLHTKDKNQSVGAYADKATSALYKVSEDAKPLSTFDAFMEAAREHRVAASRWLTQLENMTSADFEEGLGKIPKNRISPEARKFASAFLLHNMTRLRQTL